MHGALLSTRLCLVFGLTLPLAVHRGSKASLLRSRQLRLQRFMHQQPQTVRGRITMRGPMRQPLRLPRKGRCWADVSAAPCAQGA